jgi:hypothetical protein
MGKTENILLRQQRSVQIVYTLLALKYIHLQELVSTWILVKHLADSSKVDTFREAWSLNIEQYLQETASLRNESVLTMREQLFRILLNDANMNKVPTCESIHT